MDDFGNLNNLVASGGLIGTLIGIIIGTLLWLRKFLSKDKADIEGFKGRTDIILLLRDQLKLERNRTESLISALESANQQISELKDEVFKLTRQVRELKEIVEANKKDVK